MGTSTSPVEIARRGVEEAKRLGVDAVIVDTAGRLQVTRRGQIWGDDSSFFQIFNNGSMEVHEISCPFWFSTSVFAHLKSLHSLCSVQIDGDMMQELKDIKVAVKPSDTLLVVDAMTGQEAANLVKTFNDEVDITGKCERA